MKFFNYGFLATVALMASAQENGGNSASPATASKAAANPAQSAGPQLTSASIQCAKERNCKQDVQCLAACNNVPSPSAEKINETTKCVAECDQTQPLDAFITCQQKCINDNFMDHTLPPPPETPESSDDNDDSSSATGDKPTSSGGAKASPGKNSSTNNNSSAGGSNDSGSHAPKSAAACSTLTIIAAGLTAYLSL